jgi:glycosyltransferase involved in cell wall biosynthesis
MLDFLRYLQQAGCEIEYVWLESLPGKQFPWFVIPSPLRTLANVQVRNNRRFGRVLLRFNSLSDWVKAPLRLIYYQLPQHVRSIYISQITKLLRKIFLSAITTQKQSHEQQATTTITSVPNWRELLATPKEIAFAKTQVDRFKPDVVVVNYAYLANILDTLSPDERILKVILTHDVFHQRNIHLKKIGVALAEGDWDWEKESEQLCKAQVLLAIQKEDAKVFKEMAPKCEVICMLKSAVCHSHTVKQVPGRCLFVGSGAQHNHYSLQWFLENVWQILIQLIPDCSLNVCGSVCDRIKGTFPNVHFLGMLEDLEPEYSAAQVCLVPLLVGSGLKIKLVEAMSYGRACVSTSVGVQGLPEIAGKTALVADTAQDFAAAVHKLLTDADKRQSMEEEAYRYVNEKLSPKAAYQPFVDYIHQHLQQVQSKLEIVDFEETVDLSKVISSKQ